MKKIITAPADYVDDMLKGIYAVRADKIKYARGDLRCYCTATKKPGKVAIITGGGTGHLPLFSTRDTYTYIVKIALDFEQQIQKAR